MTRSLSCCSFRLLNTQSPLTLPFEPFSSPTMVLANSSKKVSLSLSLSLNPFQYKQHKIFLNRFNFYLVLLIGLYLNCFQFDYCWFQKSIWVIKSNHTLEFVQLIGFVVCFHLINFLIYFLIMILQLIKVIANVHIEIDEERLREELSDCQTTTMSNYHPPSTLPLDTFIYCKNHYQYKYF